MVVNIGPVSTCESAYNSAICCYNNIMHMVKYQNSIQFFRHWMLQWSCTGLLCKHWECAIPRHNKRPIFWWNLLSLRDYVQRLASVERAQSIFNLGIFAISFIHGSYPCILTFIHSIICSSITYLFSSFIHLFIYSFICWQIHSHIFFLYSFFQCCLFILSFVCLSFRSVILVTLLICFHVFIITLVVFFMYWLTLPFSIFISF